VRVAAAMVVEMKKTAEESTMRMLMVLFMFVPMLMVIVAALAVSSDQ